jgi:hypothetical protein
MHANSSASKIILKSARLTETAVELKNQTWDWEYVEFRP